MNLLKRMRARERVEMSLKTIAAVIVFIALTFLLEGMIFGIYMSKINENKASQFISNYCVAYCEEVGNNQYKVYLHNTDHNSWSVRASNYTKEQIEKADYAKVVYDAPNAFDVSITSSHYVVMAVLLSALLGYFAWRFYKLEVEYNKLEKKLKIKGTIF